MNVNRSNYCRSNSGYHLSVFGHDSRCIAILLLLRSNSTSKNRPIILLLNVIRIRYGFKMITKSLIKKKLNPRIIIFFISEGKTVTGGRLPAAAAAANKTFENGKKKKKHKTQKSGSSLGFVVVYTPSGRECDLPCRGGGGKYLAHRHRHHPLGPRTARSGWAGRAGARARAHSRQFILFNVNLKRTPPPTLRGHSTARRLVSVVMSFRRCVCGACFVLYYLPCLPFFVVAFS